jgi:hypothetical protein
MARMRSNDVNFMLNVINNAKYKSSKEAIASIAALRKSIKSLKLQYDYDSLNSQDKYKIDQQLFKIKLAAQEGITADLIANNAIEKAELEKKLNTIKDSYDRDYQKNYETNSRRIDNYRRKVQAMTADELKKESAKVSSDNPLQFLPGELDELSIAVKANATENFAGLRAIINNNHLNEPYLHNDIAKDIAGDLELMNRKPSGILIKTDDGRRMLLDPNEIDSFIDFQDDGKEED